MIRKTVVILALFLTILTALALYHPGGLMAYIFPSLCWGTLAITAIYMSGGLEKLRSWTSTRIVLMAFLVAVFQIFILVDAGLLNKFGTSPFSFAPTGIAINLVMVSSTLLGMELSRAYLAKNLYKRNLTLSVAAITLLYTFANISIFSLLNFQEPRLYAEFVGENFLPILTENLLATYLALMSGPMASLAYRAPLQAFHWFSPIVPDLPWGYTALIGVMTPTIGFVAINMATTQVDQRRAGIPTRRKPMLKTRKSQSSMKGWLAISVLLVLAVWTTTGLLGFYPTVVASGSMNPTLDVGDVAIVVSTDPSKIQKGDVIQYWLKEGEMILHRVVEISQTEEGVKTFITKGDANDAPDTDPVNPSQIRGKQIFTIPKLGWISIYLKMGLAEVYSFFLNNVMAATTAFAALVIVSAGAFHFYWNSPTRKLRRRIHI